MAEVLALTHIACEGPGWWGEFLDERGHHVRIVALDAGEPVPDMDRYDAVLVLGGPMNVDEEGRYPWLAAEKAAIRRRALSGRPIVGICLGAQLLARSLGARVAKNPVKEIGWSVVTLTEAGGRDPLFAGCDAFLPVLQWHGDTFDLPDGASLLATSTLCAHQAFRVGDRAYGLQFHVEATPTMIAEWADVYHREVERDLPDGAARRMVEQAGVAAASARARSRRIFQNACAVVGLG